MREKEIKINNLSVNFLEIQPVEQQARLQRFPAFYSAGCGQGLFLILHGWGSRAEKWRQVGELLAKEGCKVIIPDLPGFGKSGQPAGVWGFDDYCDFVDEFVRYLNLEKFYLLGHSFGGALAVKCGLKFPERIEKLFLVGAACLRRRSAGKKLFYILAKILKIFSFLPGYKIFRKGFYKFIIRKSDYPYARGVMKDIYLSILKEDLSPVLPLINIPTTIIWGEKDDVVPLGDAYFISQKIRNSKLVIISKGDHDLERKIPAELSEAILKNIKPGQ